MQVADGPRTLFAGLRFSHSGCLLTSIHETLQYICVGASVDPWARPMPEVGPDFWVGFVGNHGHHQPVSWTQLWVIPPPGAAAAAAVAARAGAKARAAVEQQLAERAAQSAALDGATSGYDVVVIAGQSNAVGTCAEEGFGRRDDTTGLPVHVFDFGTLQWVHGAAPSSPPWTRPATSHEHHPPTTFIEWAWGNSTGTDVSANFSRNYIANGCTHFQSPFHIFFV